MPIVDNTFVPEVDITGRRDDGRGYLIWPAGKPMNLATAYDLGFLKRPEPIFPTEVKRVDAKPPVTPTATETSGMAEPGRNVEEPTGIPITGGDVFTPDPIDATRNAVLLAQEHRIDLSTVAGTGKDGRITKYDVEAVITG